MGQCLKNQVVEETGLCEESCSWDGNEGSGLGEDAAVGTRAPDGT